MLRETKDLAETLKAKILKMTKALSNAEVMAATTSDKEKENLNSEDDEKKN